MYDGHKLCFPRTPGRIDVGDGIGELRHRGWHDSTKGLGELFISQLPVGSLVGPHTAADQLRGRGGNRGKNHRNTRVVRRAERGPSVTGVDDREVRDIDMVDESGGRRRGPSRL